MDKKIKNNYLKQCNNQDNSHDVEVKKMNFTKNELDRFKKALSNRYMFGETSHGNIEFVSRKLVGSTIAELYRLCRRKADGKLYFCRGNGENSPMFVKRAKECSKMCLNGRQGYFITYVASPETFDTVEEAAARFNRYALSYRSHIS